MGLLGEIGNPAKIANLAFDVPEDYVDRLRSSVDKSAQDALGRVASVTAARVARRMAKVISKEHKFGVGYSGRASKNIYIKSTPVGKNRVSVDIYEGDMTDANEFIRLGRRSKRMPNVKDIIKWIESKAQLSGEITYDPSKRGGARTKKAQSIKPKVIHFTKPKKSAPSRVYRQQRNALQQVAFLIARKIASAGGGERMVGLSPVGRPTFDYARYVLTGSGLQVFNSPEFNIATQTALATLSRSYFRAGLREKPGQPKWVTGGMPIEDYHLERFDP